MDFDVETLDSLKREGYWDAPVIHDDNHSQIKHFLKCLNYFMKWGDQYDCYDYCDICKKEMEYYKGNFYIIHDGDKILINSNYIHYLTVHNIRPSREFYNIILNIWEHDNKKRRLQFKDSHQHRIKDKQHARIRYNERNKRFS